MKPKIKIIGVSLLWLLSFSFSNTIYSQDFDGDGVDDFYDLDDDNDGVLDTDEGTTISFMELEIVQLPNHITNGSLQKIFDGANAHTGDQDLRIHSFSVTPGDLNGSILDNALVMGTTGANVLPLGSFFTLSLENDDVAGDLVNPIVATLVTELTALGLDPNDLFQGAFDDVGLPGLDASDFDRDGDGRINTSGVDFSPMGVILQYYNGDPNTGGTLLNTSFSQIELFNSGGVHLHNVPINAPLTHFVVSSLPDGTGKDIRVNEIQINGTVNTGLVNGKVGFNTFFFTDSDSDGTYDHMDIDSDNDGIPDNVESQPTIGYIPPTYTYNASGSDNAYAGGITPEDTDGDGEPDVTDTNSDNDQYTDIQENGMANSYIAGDDDNDGLANLFETNGVNDATLDINEDIEDPTDLSILPDTDGDLAMGGDLDYRDSIGVVIESASVDFDGVDDHIAGTAFMGGWPDATIMAWIKLDPTFSSNGDVAGQGLMRMYVNGTTKKLHSYYITNMGNSSYGSSSTTTMDTDQWYHVAISYEGASGMTKLYVNGKLELTLNIPAGTLSTNPQYANPDFNIGRHSRTDDSYFKGAVFNTVLTDSQLQQMVYQEIEEDGVNLTGSIMSKNITDVATNATIPWNNLQAYYPMTNILTGETTDASGNGRDAYLKNITTVQPQTAPMPYETTANGPWTTESTWLHGDVWDIEDVANNKDWSIVSIKNNITTSDSHSQLGLIINTGSTLAVNGNNAITNSWYLQLDGTLDLADDSQLIQSVNSDLVTSSTGKILRRQEGNSDSYWYNYWSSPVGTLAATTLTDNNGTTNNANNSPFNIDMLKDGTGTTAMQFTSTFDEIGKISDRWLYSFQNGITYYDWVTLAPASDIQPGVGYTQKGTGNAGTEQQYTFVGKPNNGTILIPATDVPDAGNESEQDVTLTTTLIGNPYPSALDADKFIRDNVDFDNGGLNPIIQGTILLWEQWAGTSHWLAEYEGGYGYINLTETARAYQHSDIVIADPTNTDNRGIKIPTKFLPVGQAFLVEVVNDGNIEFNNGQRVFKQESLDESVFFRGTQSQDNANATNDEITVRDEEATVVAPMQIIKLEFEVSNGATRQFVLGFSDITTDGFDPGYDGGLLIQRPNEDMTSILDGKPYVIQAFSPISPEKKIDLYFNSSGNFTYILDIAEIKNVDENQDIFVRDNRQNMYWNLTQDGAYHFSAFSGEDSERFDIVFNDNNSTLSGDSFILNEVLIYINNSENKLFVKGLEQPLKSLTLINMLGQTVKTYNNLDIYDLENGVSTGELSTGVYFVNLTTENNVKRNKKIILK